MFSFFKNPFVIGFLFMMMAMTDSANASKNVTVFAGGGCFSQLREEMSAEADRYAKTMSAHGWQVFTLFGGLDLVRGRDNTRDVSIPGVKPFTRHELISALETQLQNLKEGDQFLLTILTHGTYKKGGHLICLGDGSGLDLSDSAIASPLRKLNQKGVRVAVIDNSCFGGQTVSIFSEHACVLATQSGNFPSFVGSNLNQNGVTSVSLDLLEHSDQSRKISMEDLFVATSMNHPATGVFPVMSGLDRYNRLGDELAWFLLSEEKSLHRYRGHECRNQDHCRMNFTPVRSRANRRSLNGWISILSSQDRSSVEALLDSLASLNGQISPLQNDVDHFIGNQKHSKRGEDSVQISPENAVSSSIASTMQSLLTLRNRKKALLDELNADLRRLRIQDYESHRSELVNPQIESCRRFKLN